MDRPFSSPRRLFRIFAAVCLIGLEACTGASLLHAGEKHTKPHKESKRAGTREIEALEMQWRDAMLKSDSVTLDRLLADDFLGISPNGTVTDKQQYLHRVARRQNQFSDIELLGLKIRMQPTIAIAVSQARVSGEVDGRPLSGTFRYTKVYGRRNGGWRVLNFEATRVSGPGADGQDLRGGLPLASKPQVR